MPAPPPTPAARALRGRRPPGDLHRRDGRRSVRLAQQVAGRACLLAGHARQPLDERSELVLAEEPQHLVAVVVAQPRRLQVELDRHVRVEP